jgi:hypothetical protein
MSRLHVIRASNAFFGFSALTNFCIHINTSPITELGLHLKSAQYFFVKLLMFFSLSDKLLFGKRHQKLVIRYLCTINISWSCLIKLSKNGMNNNIL